MWCFNMVEWFLIVTKYINFVKDHLRIIDTKLKVTIFNRQMVPSELLTTIIHCPCYCGLLVWKWICAGFYHLFIYVLPLEIQLSRGEGWDSTNRFTPAIFLCLYQDRIYNFQRHISWYFWVQMTSDYSFCWYWWNWRLSLFKLSFHKFKI